MRERRLILAKFSQKPLSQAFIFIYGGAELNFAGNWLSSKTGPLSLALRYARREKRGSLTI